MTEQAKLDAINAAVTKDPELQDLIRRQMSGDTSGVTSPFDTPATRINQRLESMGLEIPKAWKFGADGAAKQQSWFQRNMDWVVPAMIIGGGVGAGFATGAIGGTSAAGIGAPAAASAGGTGAATAGAGTAATTAGTAGTVAATKAGTSFWDKIAKASPIIDAATGIIGTKMATDANKASADAQLKAAEEALAFQKDVYNQRQRQLAPAIGVGNASTVRMGELMGIQTPEGGYTPQTTAGPGGVPITAVGNDPLVGYGKPDHPVTKEELDAAAVAQGRMAYGKPDQPVTRAQVEAAAQAQAVPRGTMAPQVVTMKAPTGQPMQVPADQVEHYQQRGAQVVG